jgi:hypothetical protein
VRNIVNALLSKLRRTGAHLPASKRRFTGLGF